MKWQMSLERSVVARLSGPLLILGFLGAGCGEKEPEAPGWEFVLRDQPGALLSVWGTSERDIWIVGSDARDGTGPMVLHYDGEDWTRQMTGLEAGDLWWVFGFEGGPIYMGGAGGVVLSVRDGEFTRMQTPGTDTVFGIWGASPDDMWAVGGRFDQQGFAWRLVGEKWSNEPSLPDERVEYAAMWKVFGRSSNDAWLVGSNGVSFYFDGERLEEAETGVGSSLFTVHANSQRFVAVGGLAGGFIVENDGTGWSRALETTYGLAGVALDEDSGFAVGQYGLVYKRDEQGWGEVPTELIIDQDLHAVWIDPTGGVWAVGGHTISPPLSEGLLIHGTKKG